MVNVWSHPQQQVLATAGDKSPAPWVPSSRHARILSSFHIHPSPTTKPRRLEDSHLRRNGEHKGALKRVLTAAACPGGSSAVARKGNSLQHSVPGAGKGLNQQGQAPGAAQAAGAAHPSSTAASPRVQQAATELGVAQEGLAAPHQQSCIVAACTSEGCVQEQQEGSAEQAATPDASLPQPRASLPTAYSFPTGGAPAAAMPAVQETPLSGAADAGAQSALAGSSANAACSVVEAVGTSFARRPMLAANELGAAAADTSKAHANQPATEGSGGCLGGARGGGECGHEQQACTGLSGNMPCCGEDLEGEGMDGGCPMQQSAAIASRGVLIRRVALSTPVVLRRLLAAEGSEGGGAFCK